MRILFIVMAAGLMSGCPDKPPVPPQKAPAAQADNAATQYVGGLKNDLDQAKKTAAAATDAIKAREAEAAKQPDPQ
ncbi:MAG: hypothetical protein A2V88_03050 [Elusimicrobia bacterium RBG_16_66_12]|nr:MAG: hypothetical protein A2V88_03050 [Elusimicrobia bacterium RBG_16_66_12]